MIIKYLNKYIINTAFIPKEHIYKGNLQMYVQLNSTL